MMHRTLALSSLLFLAAAAFAAPRAASAENATVSVVPTLASGTMSVIVSSWPNHLDDLHYVGQLAFEVKPAPPPSAKVMLSTGISAPASAPTFHVLADASAATCNKQTFVATLLGSGVDARPRTVTVTPKCSFAVASKGLPASLAVGTCGAPIALEVHMKAGSLPLVAPAVVVREWKKPGDWKSTPPLEPVAASATLPPLIQAHQELDVPVVIAPGSRFLSPRIPIAKWEAQHRRLQVPHSYNPFVEHDDYYEIEIRAANGQVATSAVAIRSSCTYEVKLSP